MPCVHSLHVQDCFLLQDVSLPFREGVTFLGGINLDRSTGSSGNAVGKSMLWSLFGGVLYQEQLWATKGVRNTNKSVIGKVSLSFSAGNDAYEVRQVNKGSKATYALSKNGEDLDIHTTANVVSAVSKLLPINKAHYISTVYIGGDSTPILRGSSADRISFFSSLWDFSSYQKKHDFFKKKVSDLKTESTRLNVYKTEADSIEYIDVTDKKAEESALLEKIEDTKQRVKKGRAIVSKYQAYCEVDKDKPTESEDYYQSVLDSCRKKQLAYENYAEQLARWKRYSRASKALTDSLHNVQSITDEDITPLAEELEKAKAYADFWKTTGKYVPKYRDHWDTSISPSKEEREEVKAKISSLKADLEKLIGLGDTHVCPTCLHDISDEYKSSAIKGIQKKLSRAEEEYIRLDASAFYSAFHEEIDYGEDESYSRYEEAQANYRKASSQLSQYKQDLVTRDKIAALEPCEEPTESVEDVQDKIDSASKSLAALRIYEDKRHPTLEGEELRSKYDTLESRLESLEDELELATRKLAELRLDISRCDDTNKRLEYLLDRSSRLSDVNDELEMAGWLRTQYSSKGVQQAYMHSVITAYISNLNNLYSTILPNPPEFSFYLEGNNFDILAKRNGHNVDIRSFSKSEGKQFCAVSALALRSILPPEYVLDTIIFDEVEEGMSAFERDQFITSFIPYAASVVHKVIVVTPRIEVKDMIDGFAYVLKRENNVTELVEA